MADGHVLQYDLPRRYSNEVHMAEEISIPPFVKEWCQIKIHQRNCRADAERTTAKKSTKQVPQNTSTVGHPDSYSSCLLYLTHWQSHRETKENCFITDPHRGGKKRDTISNTSKPRQGRCETCEWKKDVKTTIKCEVFKDWTCRKHANLLCSSCKL